MGRLACSPELRECVGTLCISARPVGPIHDGLVPVFRGLLYLQTDVKRRNEIT